MMNDYGTIHTNMDSNIGDVKDSLKGVKNISFDGIWSGSAYDKLSKDLSSSISKVDTLQADFETFSSAVDKLDTYKANKEEADRIQTEINGISVPDSNEDPDGAAAALDRISKLEAARDKLLEENKALKAEIEALLNGISTIESELSAVVVNLSDYTNYMDYVFDIDKLKADYSGYLRMLGVSDSLYNYYNSYNPDGTVIPGSGKKYVESVILGIQNKYSGREASVNSALAILKLAADKGVKINYQHAGTMGIEPYVPTAAVVSGIDCNPFVSWALDKGTPNGFQWRPVTDFVNIGKTVSRNNWGNSLPGDVLANGKHVSLIVANDPVNHTFTIAQSSGAQLGVNIITVSYQTLMNTGYTVRDMTDIYNGSVNTDREIFNQYVDFNTYQRKV